MDRVYYQTANRSRSSSQTGLKDACTRSYCTSVCPAVHLYHLMYVRVSCCNLYHLLYVRVSCCTPVSPIVRPCVLLYTCITYCTSVCPAVHLYHLLYVRVSCCTPVSPTVRPSVLLYTCTTYCTSVCPVVHLYHLLYHRWPLPVATDPGKWRLCPSRADRPRGQVSGLQGRPAGRGDSLGDLVGATPLYLQHVPVSRVTAT